jgi:hypothetical protein
MYLSSTISVWPTYCFESPNGSMKRIKTAYNAWENSFSRKVWITMENLPKCRCGDSDH